MKSIFILVLICVSAMLQAQDDVAMATLPVAFSLRTGRVIRGAKVEIIPGGFEITAPGFLPRRIPNSFGWAQRLWPDDEIMPAVFTFEGAHGSDVALPLTRPRPGIMTVEPSEDLVADPAAWDALQFAVANVNSVFLFGEFAFEIVPPGAGGQVYIYRDPLDPIWFTPGFENAGALAYAGIDPTSTVVAGRILFRDFGRVFYGGHLRKAMSHELAHIVGIRGHPRGVEGVAPNGVMSSPDETPQVFTFLEQDLLRWLFQRPTGTLWPDDSMPVPSVRASTRSQMIPLCRMTSSR